MMSLLFGLLVVVVVGVGEGAIRGSQRGAVLVMLTGREGVKLVRVRVRVKVKVKHLGLGLV